MSATLAERLIDEQEICAENTRRKDGSIFDQIVEVDSPDDGTAFIVIDSLMTLLVYLAPVAVFGFMVAPVVARLLSMPISR